MLLFMDLSFALTDPAKPECCLCRHLRRYPSRASVSEQAPFLESEVTSVKGLMKTRTSRVQDRGSCAAFCGQGPGGS